METISNIKIQAIKTSDGYFIKNKEYQPYSADILERISFNRILPEKTWKIGWFKVKDVTGKLELYTAPTKRTVGYVLSDEYVATQALPKEMSIEDYNDEEKYALRQLYIPIQEDVPERYDEVTWDIEIIAELEGNLVEEKINYPVYGRNPNSEGKRWSVRNSEIKLGLVDEITTPDILREERPCELSSEHSFKIIRTHIKDNIDPKTATISSDYDFCLTVEKRIPLAEKETYQIDENMNFFSRRKRKPKMVTKYRIERKKEIYKIAPRLNGKVYDKYPEAPMFRGENARNLKANIDEYLADLMEEINRPLHDCPHCKGMGVV